MNNHLHQAIFGTPKVRKTWKNSLSPEKNAARLEQMRFCKQVRKLLAPSGYTVEFHFNPGGPAVWGETYVNIFWDSDTGETSTTVRRIPVVEACLSHDFSYIRQWDGRHSGRNIQLEHYGNKGNVAEGFAASVRYLAARPFVRF